MKQVSSKKGGLFVLGDASGFLDAMTGEGNALAVHGGIAAVEAILSGEPNSFP
jgi:flavin-dependent dehydrogenase